jgi:hypothetical protein
VFERREEEEERSFCFSKEVNEERREKTNSTKDRQSVRM